MPEAAVQSDTAATQAAMPAWQELALEEYRALRGEILATMQTQDGGLRFAVAALGIVSAAGFNVWSDTTTATLIFLVVVPFVSVAVLIVWMGEVTRMMRAGRHILKLEQFFRGRISDLPYPVMRWETGLRDPFSDIRWERHYEWNYQAIVLMFWSIGVASIGAGVYRGIWGKHPLGNTTAVSAAASVVAGASVLALLLILRQLAIVCETEGWLRVLRSDRRRAVDANVSAGGLLLPASTRPGGPPRREHSKSSWAREVSIRIASGRR